jgi:hypothetical protein
MHGVIRPMVTAMMILIISGILSLLGNSFIFAEGLNKGKWAPKTHDAIKKLIQENAGKKEAYAVFDWDNTCIYPDTEENLFIYQIENLAFKMTPDEFNYAFNHYTDTGRDTNLPIPKDPFVAPYLSVDGKTINIDPITDDVVADYTYFYNNYRNLNPNAAGNLTLDQIKETDQFKDFKAKMWFTYSALYDSFAINVSYTWIMYVMFPGLTADEARDLVVKASDWGMSRESKKVYFDSPTTLPGKAGAVSNTNAGNYFRNALRLTPEMGALIETMENNKIPVYISTASLQDIIDAVATHPKYGYNLPEGRVLGMRLKKDEKGRFLPEYDTTGGYTINSVDGKTVNINKILVPKFQANPIMIAGDSDGDYFMMTELSGVNGVKKANEYKPLKLILVVNRLKGGNIGAICKIADAQLSGNVAGETMVVLQGRDENTGQWIPTEKTLKLGKFGDENLKLLP